MSYIKKLEERFKNRLKKDEDLSKYTTLRIGGRVGIFIHIHDEQELIFLLKQLNNYNISSYFILGNGSNVLIKEDKEDKIAIKLGGSFKKINKQDNFLTVGSAALLSETLSVAKKNSLSGLEFTTGIPGSIGGSIYCNAGAYGSCMAEIIEEVYLFEPRTLKRTIKKQNQLNFSYRSSNIKEEIIIGARLRLSFASKNIIKNKIEELKRLRKSSQPYGRKTAGCIFKNPSKEISAAKLIEEAGLKGKRLGNVKVSDKHANFIENVGNAKSDEVISLINLIKEKVYEKFNIILEEEIRII